VVALASGRRQRVVPGRLARQIERPDRLVFNYLLSRSQLAAELGGTSGLDRPGRDLDKECGYPTVATINTYRRLYNREGIAKRVNDIFPDECWSQHPWLYETEDDRITKFERAWDKLNKRIPCWHYLHRADRLSGLGHFGIILLGLDDGRPLNEPVRGMRRDGEKSQKVGKRSVKLLYLRVFPEDCVTIAKKEENPNNPRHGQPVLYSVTFSDPSGTDSTSFIQRDVHWTRVIHIADGCESSVVYGTPRMRPVLNRLLDLRKILGGSAEMFWKGAFPGYAFETLPELLGESTINEDSVRDQFEEYMEGLKRYLALDGVKAVPLLPQTADPTNHVTQQILAICATITCPYRIFLGSEAGHLASTQDAGNWNKKVAARQRLYLDPMLIRPFVDRLIAIGVLPEPGEVDYIIRWHDVNTSSDTEKANVALKKAQALGQYVSMGCEAAMTLKRFYISILGMTEAEATSAINELEAEKKKFTDPLGEEEAERNNDLEIKKMKAAPKPVPSTTAGGAKIGGKPKPLGGGRVGNPARSNVGRPAGKA
jgi:hypothetical protein